MLKRLSLLVVALLVLAACGAVQGTPPAEQAPQDEPAPAAPAQPATGSDELTPVTIAMSFIPNVQFAHLYVAHSKGYYAEEGLDLAFDYNYETDVVQRVATWPESEIEFGLASGDSVLLARAQDLPVVTVATNSQRFPIVIFSRAEEGIAEPADLKGRTVGIPGRFGSSYIGLLALLYGSGMEESDINLQEIGFTQAAAVSEGKVQAATGYANNEPLMLREQGIDVNVISVADAYPLASDGFIVSERLIAERPELVRGFVRATLRGMQDVIDDLDAALQITYEYVPEAENADAALQRRVLEETTRFWQSDATAEYGLGYTQPEQWQATYTFLRDKRLLQRELDVAAAYTNQFLE